MPPRVAGEGIAQLLTARDVCALLKIGRTTFYTLEYFKQRAIRIRGVVRYRLSDVLVFEQQRGGQ